MGVGVKLTVIPMSSGEYAVQIERGRDMVSNHQVPAPVSMISALAESDARRVIAESFDYLMERRDGALPSVVLLDDLWSRDEDFEAGVRERLLGVGAS
jgi:hypothetical protein